MTGKATKPPTDDERRRDQVLKRMLQTPPKTHKPTRDGGQEGASKPHRKKEREA